MTLFCQDPKPEDQSIGWRIVPLDKGFREKEVLQWGGRMAAVPGRILHGRF